MMLSDSQKVLKEQEYVDQIQWYHEFDFPSGAKARSSTPDIGANRRAWSFIEKNLNHIDFQSKSVLEIGCWDGYWSFYAEKRGAKRVLATDDKTQNWAGGAGLGLAKGLLNSGIETREDVSIYKASELGETFDIILCLGVYYHLVDPFYAFAQIRHCCHAESLVLFEGDMTYAPPPNSSYFSLTDHRDAIFVPTRHSFNQLLEATYFEVNSQSFMKGGPPRNWKFRLRSLTGTILAIGNVIHGAPGSVPRPRDRVFTVCRPATGRNRLHYFKPPFDLHKYDNRFQ
jgi:tRNA (mo5U34)-methyltransferase